MVKIIVYGLDNLAAIDASKEMQKSLLKLLNIEENELDFIAVASSFLNNGIEQNSYKGLVNILIPDVFVNQKKEILDTVENVLKTYLIQFDIIFRFYSKDNLFTHFNEDYPKNINSTSLFELMFFG